MHPIVSQWAELTNINRLKHTADWIHTHTTLYMYRGCLGSPLSSLYETLIAYFQCLLVLSSCGTGWVSFLNCVSACSCSREGRQLLPENPYSSEDFLGHHSDVCECRRPPYSACFQPCSIRGPPPISWRGAQPHRGFEGAGTLSSAWTGWFPMCSVLCRGRVPRWPGVAGRWWETGRKG